MEEGKVEEPRSPERCPARDTAGSLLLCNLCPWQLLEATAGGCSHSFVLLVPGLISVSQETQRPNKKVAGLRFQVGDLHLPAYELVWQRVQRLAGRRNFVCANG